MGRGKGKLGQSERVAWTYIHYQMIQFCSFFMAALHRELNSVLCDDLDGWDGGGRREVQEGEDICIHIADSLRCTAETNTTL